MNKSIDHEAEANRLMTLASNPRDSSTETIALCAQTEATLALVEQQKIANRLEYTRLAIETYGNYVPGGANLPSLFAPPETDQGNMRVPEDIATALGIDEMSMTNQLEELAKRATPGPWHWDEDERDLLAQSLELVWGTDGDPEIADAEFIAAANPQMVLTLIERVKTAEAALDADERQIEARSGETAGERLWKERA
jgi:hypothetical protein